VLRDRRPAPVIVARAQDVAFRYGRSGPAALDGASLEVAAGEVVVLEGPSGGGKSTLLRAFAGLVPHFHGGRFEGRVIVDGLDTRRTPPAAVARRAGLLFQDPEAQAVLATAERDVAFGPQNAGLPAEEIQARVREALADAGALALRERRIEDLSSGERQRVALAGVLASRPALLLLDEPTSQLDEEAAAALAATVRRLADERGIAVVIAEHRIERVRHVADRILAVRAGRVSAPVPWASAEAATPPNGELAIWPTPPRPNGQLAIALEAVDAGYPGRPVLRRCSLGLAPGTVTALTGPNGSGKSTLVRVLAGLHRPDRGRVRLGEVDVTAEPAERRFPRIGLVGQDPGRHLLCERVSDEVGYALRRLGAPTAEIEGRVAREMRALDIEALAERHPLDLSVGERERVALAAVLVARPAALVLDEPTRGMDPERKASLAGDLRARAAEGAAVLVATHDATFAARAADRHVALAGVQDGRPALQAVPAG